MAEDEKSPLRFRLTFVKTICLVTILSIVVFMLYMYRKSPVHIGEAYGIKVDRNGVQVYLMVMPGTDRIIVGKSYNLEKNGDYLLQVFSRESNPFSTISWEWDYYTRVELMIQDLPNGKHRIKSKSKYKGKYYENILAEFEWPQEQDMYFLKGATYNHFVESCKLFNLTINDKYFFDTYWIQNRQPQLEEMKQYK
ncbi:hypothetical protein ACFL54_09375 [Planctomycetota bacterium]